MTITALSRRLPLLFAVLTLCCSSSRAAPFIQGFAPEFGPPGTQVRIVGSGFRPTATPPIVQFGTSVASLISANQVEIKAVVPDGATIGPITVTVPNGGGSHTSTRFFYLPPRINDFGTEILGSTGGDIIFKKPVIATQGAKLIIIGANFFVPNFPGLLVKVGAIPISAGATAETQIQATLPALLETGFVSVHTQVGGTTNTDEYVYGPPRIASFTPRAAAGETIQIVGVNFLTKIPSQLTVRIGVVGGVGGAVASEVEVQSNTNLLAVVPADAVTGNVSVAVPGGRFITLTNFMMLPKIASFTPGGGPAGTVVTINGSGLTGTTQVRFGNLSASAITNVSSLKVTAVVPANPVTGPITVTAPGGTNVSAALFYGPPAADNFTPSQGGTGALVTVNGLNFTDATQVRLNDDAVPNFTVTSNTRLTFNVPADATSGRITVITPGGTNTTTASFVVQGSQPLITSFNPASGGSGTEVTLKGLNLASATAVAFNGVNATFHVAQETNLVATVPLTATTGKIRVTTPDGAAESALNFTVGSTADVRILFAANPSTGVAFASLVYNLQALNSGPLTAQNTVIEFTIPPGMVLLETTGPLQPVINGQKLTYNRGQLDPGAVFLAGVRVNAGPPTNVVAFGRVLTSTPDTNTVNNERFTSNTVALPKLIIEDIGEPGVLLSWPSIAGTAYRLNAAPALEEPFVPVPDQPIDDGASLQLTIPTTNSARLFRLQLLGQ